MQVISRKHLLFNCPALVLVGLVGCGGPYDASVQGYVTLDGSPISTGAISCIPSKGGPQAYAHISDTGHYEVYTGAVQGLPSGDYQVTVVAREPSTIRSEGGGPPPPGKAITPPWYKSTKTSGLTFKVEQGSNDIDIPLTSDPPPDWKPPKKRRRR